MARMIARSCRYWMWHIDWTQARKPPFFFCFHNHTLLLFCCLEFPLGFFLCPLAR
jgi:hypothetical protein